MALLIDPKSSEPIKVGERTYFMKPATVAERTRWRRATAAGGGRQHGPVGMLNCLSAGVKALMKDSPAPARDAVLEKIEAQKTRVIAFFQAAQSAVIGADQVNQDFVDAGSAMNEGAAGLAVIIDEVTANYPAFAQMNADDQTYWAVSGLEAMRMFCTGWEGIEATFERGPGGVSDDLLAEIPEADLPFIGQAYENLIKVTPQQRKNLLSQRLSSPAVETLST